MVRNEDILKDIILKMNYDPSKSLNENIEEQESSFTRNLDRIYSNPNTAREYNREMTKFVDENKHTLLDIAAIGFFFIPGIGPLISLGLELANSGLYYAEGDEYMAGFSLAFALIPMGELVAKIPAVKKLGRNGLASLIKKARAGGKLTKTEVEAVEQISKNQRWITKTAKASAKTLLLIKNKLQRAGLKDIVYALYKYSKKHPTKFSLLKNGLIIGGIWYSYDKLAKMYGIDEQESQSQPTSSSDVEKIKVVTDFDKNWDYKKDGDKYYTKKKGTDKWILTSGKVEDAIKTKVFTSMEASEDIKKIEQMFLEDKEEYTVEILNQISPTLDNEKSNQHWDDALSDIK